MTQETHKLTPSSLTKSIATILSAFVASAAITDSTLISYDQSNGIPRNERCEAQLFPILLDHHLPFNGSARYNPWLRQCSYVYAVGDKINTYQWFPDLKQNPK